MEELGQASNSITKILILIHKLSEEHMILDEERKMMKSKRRCNE